MARSSLRRHQPPRPPIPTQGRHRTTPPAYPTTSAGTAAPASAATNSLLAAQAGSPTASALQLSIHDVTAASNHGKTSRMSGYGSSSLRTAATSSASTRMAVVSRPAGTRQMQGDTPALPGPIDVFLVGGGGAGAEGRRLRESWHQNRAPNTLGRTPGAPRSNIRAAAPGWRFGRGLGPAGRTRRRRWGR
jgi:hypothetical protein